ncbi:MAG: 2-isopropylmalate synthase [Gammaproteobacteria bacterium]|nr:2-isopropylmalate synthase [Gammaproteobacteria bacterium]
MKNNKNIIIFDTTLRDGEQSPGACMSIKAKMKIATLLDEAKVDVIEAGFPVISQGQFEGVQSVAKQVKNASVCALARALDKDIEIAGQALAQAKRPRIHTFLGISSTHRKHKLNLTTEEVFAMIASSVSKARNITDDVQWAAEDALRSEHDVLCKSVETAIKNGAKTINIADTVGYAFPHEISDVVELLLNKVPGMDDINISIHCHNDLGLAVANSLAAIQAGVSQVECTMNGIGERAGNASLEEIVMALKTRQDLGMPVSSFNTCYLTKLSRLVSESIDFPVQYNKAIVGRNAFLHESGIHQDGVLKHANTYEIMCREDIGLNQSNIFLGIHSGRKGLKHKLDFLGIDLEQGDLDKLLKPFKALAEENKEITDAMLVALVDKIKKS